MERADDNRQHVTAKKLAVAYLNRLKSRNVHHQPWSPGTPVEETGVWRNFLATADIVNEMNADPKLYIAAQFEGLRWAGKSRFPFPSQLHTDNARLRYIQFMEDHDAKEAKLAKEEHKAHGSLEREEAKLLALKRRFKLKRRAVLCQMPDEFSEAIHRKYGTWEKVREEIES